MISEVTAARNARVRVHTRRPSNVSIAHATPHERVSRPMRVHAPAHSRFTLSCFTSIKLSADDASLPKPFTNSFTNSLRASLGADDTICARARGVRFGMGDSAFPGMTIADGRSPSWRLVLAPWSEEQCAALRSFGNDESRVLLFALKIDGGKLEVFVTCRIMSRVSWLSKHVMKGEWRPAAAPTTKEERLNLLAQYHQSCRARTRAGPTRWSASSARWRGSWVSSPCTFRRCVAKTPTLRMLCMS